MFLKIFILVLFFAVMIGVGIYCRKSAANVQGFFLGDRKVGSWLTAFACLDSYLFLLFLFFGGRVMRRNGQKVSDPIKNLIQ